MTLVGPKPFCEVAKIRTKTAIKLWMQKSLRINGELPRTKQFIKEQSLKFMKKLLSLNRRVIRIMVTTIGLAKEGVLCRFCREEKETAPHILCFCEGLITLRFLQTGEENLSPGYCIKEHLVLSYALS